MMSALKHVFAALTLAASAAAAQAGTITAATGPIRVNGKDVTLAPGKTIVLKKDDVFETLKATVTYRSDSGDDITFDADDVAREMETDSHGAAVFLSKGAATGVLSEKTNLGVGAGWVAAPAGGKTKVYVEASAGREAVEALFRAINGTAWVRYNDFYVALRDAHSVTLDVVPNHLGYLQFRTGQQNAGEVEVHKRLSGGEVTASVPKATLGFFDDVPGENKTKICNDINSLKTAKIRLETRIIGKPNANAEIGPGTCAQIDNATGAIEVLFTAVKFEILERAISLTSEFSTLAQSNFSDVK